MKRSKIEAPCFHCKGTGRAELTETLSETYRLLESQSDEISAAKLARKHGGWVTHDAMKMRLAKLETAGLASRKKVGSIFLWKAVTPEPS